MSQQIINISIPDDGLGDVLRNSFDKSNQNFTELYNSKVDKITGKGLSENDFTNSDKAKLNGIEAGAQVNVQADAAETDPLSPSYIQNFPPSLYSAVGHFHYADLATQTTPLAVVANVPKKITNDTLGMHTELDFAPYAVPTVWDNVQNSFDFSNLDLGDSASLRLDLAITTTATNQTIQLYLKFGVGTASEYDLLIDSWNEKSTVTFKHFLKTIDFSIDNQDWKSAPAELFILSDANASVKVNGFYIPIIRKSVNIVNFNSDPLKLDKSTTPSSVYGTDVSGGQTMIPMSDFGTVKGTGTTNRISKFTASGTIGDSQIFDNGISVGIGAESTSARLDLRAQGALATDIVFRVRNSTNTRNFLVVNGVGDVYNNGAGGVSTNTFFGEGAGRNATGNSNSLFGFDAGSIISSGGLNSFFGVQAGLFTNTGGNNTFVGTEAGRNNSSASNNTAIGQTAGRNNTIGAHNVFIGVGAGAFAFEGVAQNTISVDSVFIGNGSRANASGQTNQIVIGRNAIGDGSNSVVLGNSSITRTRLQGQVIMGTFASAPTGIESAIYYDSTTKKHYGFNGTTWNALY